MHKSEYVVSEYLVDIPYSGFLSRIKLITKIK